MKILTLPFDSHSLNYSTYNVHTQSQQQRWRQWVKVAGWHTVAVTPYNILVSTSTGCQNNPSTVPTTMLTQLHVLN